MKKQEAAKKEEKRPIISHEEIIKTTRPAYLLGLFGGAITFIVSLFLLVRVYNTGNLFREGVISFFELGVFTHISIGILMLISVYLLRKEHHCFGGSVMLLCISIIGLNLAAGLLIGPILGIIGGILGMSEHEKLIKHNL